MNYAVNVPELTPHKLVESLYATAHALVEGERLAEAAAVFRLMLQVAPADERSWLGLALCHERIGQQIIALELYSAGTVAAEPAPRCMLGRSRMLRLLNGDDEADEALHCALERAQAARDEDVFELLSQEGIVVR